MTNRVFFLLVFGVLSLHFCIAQSSKDMLLNKEWMTVLGNKLKITNDSLFIDHHRYLINGLKFGETTKSKLTDSTFLMVLNNTDTVLNLEYFINEDSLRIKYLPIHSKNKNPIYGCSFYSQPICYLSDKSATYYSQKFLRNNDPKLKFKIITISNNYFELELYKNGFISFHQKRLDFNYGLITRNQNAVTPGLYQGYLSEWLVDSINKIIKEKELLKSYLFMSQEPIVEVTDYNSIGVTVGWDSILASIAGGSLYSLIINEFKNQIMVTNNIEYIDSLKSVSNKSVRYALNSKEAVSGICKLIDSVSTIDSIIYIYEMKVSRLHQNSSQGSILFDTVYFFSGLKLSIENKKKMISYITKSAYYQDLNYKDYNIDYNIVSDVFEPNTHLIFNYQIQKQQEEIKQMVVRSKYSSGEDHNKFFIKTEPIPPPYYPSDIDYKIVNKLKELYGVNFIKNLKQSSR